MEEAAKAERWRPEVSAFADLMEAQLRANDHKSGWKGDNDVDLFERLGEEKAELLSALHRHAKRLAWGDGWVMETDTEGRIGREAADVANFAMMIADVCGALAPAQPSAVQALITYTLALEAEVARVLEGCIAWQKAALECPSWYWDGDQHEAATETLRQASALHAWVKGEDAALADIARTGPVARPETGSLPVGRGR